MKKIAITICCGLNCATRGGQELLDLIESDPFIMKNCNLDAKECRSLCCDGNQSPVVIIEDQSFTNMTADRLIELLHAKIKSK
jgi:NADH:ubiquinone oxidoreductase subunit E